MKQIPPLVLADCAQLVKANSIIGNKKETGAVRVVYTPWSNLYKTKVRLNLQKFTLDQ